MPCFPRAAGGAVCSIFLLLLLLLGSAGADCTYFKENAAASCAASTAHPGAADVGSSAECTEAARDVGAVAASVVAESETQAGWPPGCYVFVDELYFNTPAAPDADRKTCASPDNMCICVASGCSTAQPATVDPAATLAATPPAATASPATPAPTPSPTDAQPLAANQQALDRAGGSAVAVAAVAGFVAGPAAATAGALLVMGDSRCAAGEKDLGRMLHPTGLRIRGSLAAGVVVGNLLIVFATVLVLFCLLRIFVKGRCISDETTVLDAEGLLRFPSLPLFVLLLFYQGTVVGAFELASSGGEAAMVVLGGAALAFLLGAPVAIVVKIKRDIPPAGTAGRAFYMLDPTCVRGVAAAEENRHSTFVAVAPTDDSQSGKGGGTAENDGKSTEGGAGGRRDDDADADNEEEEAALSASSSSAASGGGGSSSSSSGEIGLVMPLDDTCKTTTGNPLAEHAPQAPSATTAEPRQTGRGGGGVTINEDGGSSGPGVRVAKRRSRLVAWVIGPGEWVSTSKRNLWVQRYQAMVKSFKQRYAWYVAADFAMAVAIGAAAAVKTDDLRTCGHVRTAMAAANFVALAFEARLRPHARSRDTAADCARFLLQGSALVFTAAAFYSEDQGHWGFAAASPTFLAAAAVLAVKLSLDVGAEMYIIRAKRRPPLQEAAWVLVGDEPECCFDAKERGGGPLLPPAALVAEDEEDESELAYVAWDHDGRDPSSVCTSTLDLRSPSAAVLSDKSEREPRPRPDAGDVNAAKKRLKGTICSGDIRRAQAALRELESLGPHGAREAAEVITSRLPCGVAPDVTVVCENILHYLSLAVAQNHVVGTTSPPFPRRPSRISTKPVTPGFCVLPISPDSFASRIRVTHTSDDLTQLATPVSDGQVPSPVNSRRLHRTAPQSFSHTARRRSVLVVPSSPIGSPVRRATAPYGTAAPARRHSLVVGLPRQRTREFPTVPLDEVFEEDAAFGASTMSVPFDDYR
ncbi:hypothetical protein DIPPA_06951 [Diplonema papillatum]|nr:hypothetical protein DIPPA_06951 [Diplonema papillatum]